MASTHLLAGPEVLVAGPAICVWHDVIGRPGGPHSWGQGALRSCRAGRSTGGQGFSSKAVEIGRRLVSAGVAHRRYSTDYVDHRGRGPRSQARHVAGQLHEAMGMPGIVTGHAFPPGWSRSPAQAVEGRGWQT